MNLTHAILVARQRYELADSEMAYWANQHALAPEGSATKRICFSALDIATTRREEAFVNLLRVVEGRAANAL